MYIDGRLKRGEALDATCPLWEHGKLACSIATHTHTNPDTSTHTMAFLFSANSMAMVAPILTCAALRTHTRRAQHACAASRQSRHQTTYAAAAMRAATQPDCLAPTRLICAHPPAAHIHQPNRPRLARRA